MTQHNRSKNRRVETGVVQFDDDWPGIFIRGDNAFGYAQALRSSDDPIQAFAVKGLIELLESCVVGDGFAPDGARRLSVKGK